MRRRIVGNSIPSVSSHVQPPGPMLSINSVASAPMIDLSKSHRRVVVSSEMLIQGDHIRPALAPIGDVEALFICVFWIKP